MANPAKGEIEVAPGVIFSLSMNAICALEAMTGKGIFEIVDELKSWSPPLKILDGKSVAVEETEAEIKARLARVRMGVVRDIFLCGLRDHQPDMTAADAAELMRKTGGVIGTWMLISKGLDAAFGVSDAVAGAAKDATANPRRRRRAA